MPKIKFEKFRTAEIPKLLDVDVGTVKTGLMKSRVIRLPKLLKYLSISTLVAEGFVMVRQTMMKVA
jgi:hypothetical protein